MAEQQDEHYFTADPSVPFERQRVEFEAWGQELVMESGSGVFAKGRLDIGTAALFRETEPPVQGRFLDLGCGYGAIGLTIARAVPLASVIGIDVNERAVKLMNDNAKALGVESRVVACTPGQVPTDYTFDEIWSNPPIRIGKEALHELLLTWFPRLLPGGRAVMVVGKHLGGDSLQRWITEQGYPTERIGQSKGFRVLESIRPT